MAILQQVSVNVFLCEQLYEMFIDIWIMSVIEWLCYQNWRIWLIKTVNFLFLIYISGILILYTLSQIFCNRYDEHFKHMYDDKFVVSHAILSVF